ncbi:MAG: hypothetical protein KDA44_15770 [Planctomycetales bacterium]|nr:hypothetical protein [Planctomycetales bacterium]
MSHFPDESARSSSVAGSAGRPRPAPQLFRFGLRQLFAAVTLSTLLAALMATLPGAWPWVIGGVVAMVGAHVFGTLIGTRLRDTSRDVQLWRSSLGLQESDQPRISSSRPRPESLPQTTPLADRHQAPQRDRWALIAGVATGIVLGGAGIWLGWGDRLSLPAVLVGAVSCGVLGAWLALVATSFTAIAKHAVRHAHADHLRDEDRRRAAYQRKQQSGLADPPPPVR